MALNREKVGKWIEALRSGRYQQGNGYLNRAGKFCCLGVACESEGLEGRMRDPQSPVYYGKTAYAYLPPETREALGLTEEQENKLVNMNDVDMASFEEIAQQLEQWLEEESEEKVKQEP